MLFIQAQAQTMFCLACFAPRFKNNKLASYDDIRKHEDDILWGARTMNDKLPYNFYTQIGMFF